MLVFVLILKKITHYLLQEVGKMAEKKADSTKLNKFKYEIAQEMGLSKNLKKNKNKTDNSK